MMRWGDAGSPGPPSTPRPRFVDIHYRRLPDRTEVFRQQVLEETSDHVVTFLDSATIRAPLTIEGRIALEPGSPVIWFTYPGMWYDIGRFYRRDGTLTGTYANVLTPVEMRADRWDTTDLCLDVWLGVDGRVMVLDEEDLREAEANGWIDPERARTARRVAAELVDAARVTTWPPPHVNEWTLDRARAMTRVGGPYRREVPGSTSN